MMAKISLFIARIGDSWIGDAIGVACLFGGGWVWLLLGHALTGGVQ